MKHGRTWWVRLGERARMSLTLECWNPLDTIEVRRSIKLTRFSNQEIPFISVIIAFLCVKMEWYLYI